MMEVQKYLEEHGLEKLKEEFAIKVKEYDDDDRIVLNYNQIDSEKFHPIVCECRALILRKGTWEVLSRAFDRFFNSAENPANDDFPIIGSLGQEKVDGSILSKYFDGEKWCVSTRGMGFSEGLTPIGIPFKQIFDRAEKKSDLVEFLDNNHESTKDFTWIFELVAPENRIVTKYEKTEITLIGGRNKATGDEVSNDELDELAIKMNVRRPKSYSFNSIEEVIAATEKLDILEEGFVLVHETPNGSFRRLKIKSARYLAIAHMRDNGMISPKSIMTLIIKNEQAEYLGYFECDQAYFDFAEEILKESYDRIVFLRDKYMSMEDQKEFALTIIPKTVYSYEKSVLFNIRKGQDLQDILGNMGGKKIALALDLKNKFIDKFAEFNCEENKDK